jgi:hypothetical protein
MAEGKDAIEIERIHFCDRSQEIRRRRDVEESTGPASARVSNATILDVPGCTAVCGECVTKGNHIGEVILRAPVAAVEHDGDRVGSRAGRERKVGEGERV